MRKWMLYAVAMVASPWLAQAQDAAKTYPRRVTGEELTAHFKGDWSVSGSTSKANRINLYNNADGTFRIRQNTTSRVPDGFGNRKVDVEKNQVCLDITTTTWRGITGCYRLVETEPKAFSLVKGSYSIDYRR